jgi:hypothetical protein
MKLNSVLIAGLVSIGLLTIGPDRAFAGGHFSARSPGGYFSAGNPGGLRSASSYHLLPTPANQAWERNQAWAKYTAQNRQVQVPNVSTGTHGSAPQHNVVTP